MANRNGRSEDDATTRPKAKRPAGGKDSAPAANLDKAALFESIVETGFVGHVAADSDGILRYVNRHFAETCGYTPDELLGQHISLVHTPEQVKVSKAIIQAATRDGHTQPQEHWYLHRDGTEFPLLVACVAVESAEGIPYTALSALSLDEGHRAQIAYQILTDEMLDGFAHHELICDESGAPVDYRFLAVNPAFERMTGLKAADIVGRTVREALPGTEQSWIERYGAVALTGEPARFENYTASLDKYFEVTAFRTAPREFATIFQDTTESHRATAALRASADELSRTQRLAKTGSWTWDFATDTVTWSHSLFEVFGIEPAPAAPSFSEQEALVTPKTYKALREAIAETRETGVPYEVELELPQKEGTSRWLWSRGELLPGPDGTKLGLWGTAQDITERKAAEAERLKLEAQLARAQRLESVGRLAGSVAHDFNNMLTVILGHVDQALSNAGPEDRARFDLKEIRLAADRSAELTRQLLAFARNQPASPSVIDLNQAVSGIATMLTRLIGENITLTWRHDEDLGAVKLDPSHVGQILTNLCVNARDAMPDGGTIVIETANVSLDEEYCSQNSECVPGDYVQLAVTDSGSGMDAPTLAQVFEPFFTTKELGQGTGLGLATVYGIARQNHGFTTAYSEPGVGTTIRVYLPRHDSTPGAARPNRAPAVSSHDDPDHQATILLVEDEPAILTLATHFLEGKGHTVLATDSPNEAIRLAEDHAEPISLLLTDVIMPEMNGQVLADRLKESLPDLKVLFMSGYTSNVVKDLDTEDSDVHFIEKPFHLRELSRKVHEALDA